MTTVYLAEVTDDLDPLRTKLARSLQQRNLRVIPHAWYSRDPDAFRQAVEDGLHEADLFVQLLSELPGRKPPELDGGYVGFQYRRAAQIGLPILQWRSKKLDVANVERDVEDSEHRALLLGATVLAVEMDDFSREIIEQRGIAYSLPIKSGQAEEIRKDLEANLLECDGMIVVYGQVSTAWVRGQLREFRKLAYRREKPARALAIFEWPPVPKDPVGLVLPNLKTIDCTAGIQESRLAPFLEALFKEAVVQSTH